MLNNKNQQNLLQAFEAATSDAGGGYRLLNGNVLVSMHAVTGTALKIDDREVYLHDIRACEMHRGYGTQAMKFLTALADKHDIDMVLHASPSAEGDDAPDSYTLIQFYKDFGFFKSGSNNLMARKAQPPERSP